MYLRVVFEHRADLHPFLVAGQHIHFLRLHLEEATSLRTLQHRGSSLVHLLKCLQNERVSQNNTSRRPTLIDIDLP